MTQNKIPKPKVVSQDKWLAERLKLLEHEKELTKQRDRVNAERRRLPMVKVEKDYFFDSPEGKRSLKDLFEGRMQLIVYHFMYDPAWEEGCSGCTGYIDALGKLTMLNERDTTMVIVSRAPLPKIEQYKMKRGWSLPWVSSFGSDFNCDYHVTLDAKAGLTEYNYRDRPDIEGEEHGISVFFRVGDDVYHTYSVYARGNEGITDAYNLLDLTPYGRQEDFEDSPPGWPQKPTYG
jgi:predicted dithiol-disulfide oxidoreductase (DUF899 family)